MFDHHLDRRNGRPGNLLFERSAFQIPLKFTLIFLSARLGPEKHFERIDTLERSKTSSLNDTDISNCDKP